MRALLKNIEPEYLDSPTIQRSEIWGNIIEFAPSTGTVLWGPSGQGKSTLLRILYGLETRFRGDLLFDDLPPSSPPHNFWPSIRADRLAFVSQNFRLFEEQSGWKNLQNIPHWANGVRESTLKDWAEEIGIDHVLHRPAATYSQGQQQRLCLLRALASPFELILLDEPVSHLDPDAASKSIKLTLRICGERRAGWILSQQTPETHLPAEQVLRL